MKSSDRGGRFPILFWDVDTQVDFLDPEGKLYVPEAVELTKNLRLLTEAARRHRLPVIASADDHQPGDAEISDEPDWETTYPPHCMRGTPGAERILETQRPDAAEVGHQRLPAEEIARLTQADPPVLRILKKSFDVFSNPNTGALVSVLCPGHIVVYGVALDVCNRYAIEGLLERDWTDLALVTDATKAIRPESAESLLEDWRQRGVEMVTTAEVLDALAAAES